MSLGNRIVVQKRSRGHPGNYRFIPFFCIDVKVLTKGLAHRLQRFLPTLIHQDPKSHVIGRWMHQHIGHLTDTQDLFTHRVEDACATFLDFGKAYDRVNWTYTFRVVKNGVGNVSSTGSASVQQHEAAVDNQWQYHTTHYPQRGVNKAIPSQHFFPDDDRIYGKSTLPTWSTWRFESMARLSVKRFFQKHQMLFWRD